MARSIAETSVKITGDESGAIAAFRRTAEAASSSGAEINREVDKLVKGVKKKWSAADVGKDVLKGMGIGSGFAVAEQVAEHIVGYWRQAAEYAKQIEDSSERQLKATLAGIKLRQTDEQQLADMRAEADRMQANLTQASQQSYAKTFKGGMGADAFSLVEDKSRPRAKTAEETASIAALAASWQELDTQIKSVEDKLVDKKLGDFFGDMDKRDTAKERAEALKATFDQQSKAGFNLAEVQKKIGEAMAKSDEETRKLVQSFEDIADPSLRYQRQLEQLDSLQRAGIPLAGGYAAAIDAVKKAMADDQAGRVGAALGNFFDDLDADSKRNFEKMSANERLWAEESMRLAGGAADHMTTAWVDALNGVGGAWSNLRDVVIREIEAMVVKMLIVVPIMQAIGAMLGGMNFSGSLVNAFKNYGGGKAGGGPVEAGTTYRVNEEGQEFFRPDTGGTIIPVGAARSMGLGAAAGGGTYYIDARGADREGIAQLWSALQRVNSSIDSRAVGAVVGQRFKSAGFRRAMG